MPGLENKLKIKNANSKVQKCIWNFESGIYIEYAKQDQRSDKKLSRAEAEAS
jgi:hypothetical protein